MTNAPSADRTTQGNEKGWAPLLKRPDRSVLAAHRERSERRVQTLKPPIWAELLRGGYYAALRRAGRSEPTNREI